MGRKRVIVVGATGSIGSQTIDVLLSRPEEFEVVGLSAHIDEAGLLAAARPFPRARLALSGAPPTSSAIRLQGRSGLEELLRGECADLVVNGAAGSGGLYPSLVALESGSDLALANKESIVMAWPLLAAAAKTSKRHILPIDSEHSALFRLLSLLGSEGAEELVITASGGAFRDRPLEELPFVSADEAAAHPNWHMGRKITIDSATMANKGLEVIEASRLFGMEPDRIKVLIHPQSLVHALVRARDGSLYAQVTEPDMRVPIQAALTWPDVAPCPFGRLELAGKSLEFRTPDSARYPLLGLAYEALAAGEGATVAYNAADEVAVAAFEEGRIPFTGIASLVAAVLKYRWPSRTGDLTSILKLDAEARAVAAECSQ